MGLLLAFYAGSADAIGAAATMGELERLRAGSPASRFADFSLHISPVEIDVLSETLAAEAGVEVPPLTKSLRRRVGGREGESGAETVSDDWVAGVAAVDPSVSSRVAAAWFSEVGGSPEEATPPEVAQAVQALVTLCRAATRARLDVVFVWSL